MCGIVGVLGGRRENLALLERMTSAIVHRGPDDGGVWSSEDGRVWLGHRRLSILDLSPSGRQPMFSASKRFVVVYNGEIYNHLALRKELERSGLAPAWRGHSDTETLLAAIEAWGIERALERFVGMFAFALWDQKERTLALVRDRLGEKPLYYGWVGKSFMFASELKAFTKHPDWRGQVDPNAVAQFLRFNYVPTPRSIYQGIYKLPPGTFLQIPADAKPGTLPRSKPYWRLVDAVEQGKRAPFEGGEQEAVEALDRLLRETIRNKMLADVPLGAFLSGGIDSSTVVALMQAESVHPVQTFSIGFHETGYDEAPFASRIAKHLGTEHTELYVSPQDAFDVIPRLPEIYDEPFADSSQIPTYLVSKLTCKHVTVALSGDGGDELFGGYNRYLFAADLWRRLSRAPRGVRKMAACLLLALPPWFWDRLGRAIRVPQLRERAGDKLHKLADVLLDDQKSLYRRLVTFWEESVQLVHGASSEASLLDNDPEAPEFDSFLKWMMFMDTRTYLPDDILVKVDRASMAVSLEVRAPFLDHRIVEFAWRLPLHFKIRNGRGKWILRQVLARYVPEALFERPKMGFGVPIEHWLRGPLREWAEDLLNPAFLAETFDPGPIRQKWQEHLSGNRNWQYHLWGVLMFQAWRRSGHA